MATNPAIQRMRRATRKVAAPFWKEVAESGLDRFFLRELTDALLRDEESEWDAPRAMLRWYATNELREPTDVAAMETALTELPWVMVLDGLDEVPPERGRAFVRACVAGVRGRFATTDGRMIGTSRPQSYDREVFGGDPVERTLLPLKRERATLYMERFAGCLHADEEGERETLLKRMRKALADPATAALMTNPLLVTIMATIVIHHGEPSDRRWTLFEQYYETLYKRETERGTYASATLREHASLINAIHMHVGMSLQARSEEAAGVSALMPEYELRALIRARLLARESEDDGRAQGNEPRAARQAAPAPRRRAAPRLGRLAQAARGHGANAVGASGSVRILLAAAPRSALQLAARTAPLRPRRPHLMGPPPAAMIARRRPITAASTPPPIPTRNDATESAATQPRRARPLVRRCCTSAATPAIVPPTS